MKPKNLNTSSTKSSDLVTTYAGYYCIKCKSVDGYNLCCAIKGNQIELIDMPTVERDFVEKSLIQDKIDKMEELYGKSDQIIRHNRYTKTELFFRIKELKSLLGSESKVPPTYGSKAEEKR